jgi:hypothetical protein
MAHCSRLPIAAGCVVLLAMSGGPPARADSATAHLNRAIQLLLRPSPTNLGCGDV